MPASPADSQIFGPLFSHPAVSEIFSDEQSARYWLTVEGALATAQGKLGVIPQSAADRIAAASQTMPIDLTQLRSGTERDGFPIIDLVRQLRAQVGPEAADAVHWGATTQDILDTALILQLRAALGVIESDLARLITTLAQLADRHRHTLMVGRTHSQAALPITFGFKVANWLMPLLRLRARLRELQPRLFVVQLGGAVGTLAALGERGLEVQSAFAAELNLAVAPMAWHTQRDTVAELASWLSLLSGSLAKIAQDIILLAQSEVAEVREAAGGTSSTMPQKSNPITSELIVAAARLNASLLGSMHHALIQDHERGTHGWQLEWLTLPQMLTLTASALTKTVFVIENLVVDETRMRANVQATHGLMLAESLTLALSPTLNRTTAKRLVTDACRIAVDQHRHLVEVVRELTTAPVDWVAISDETQYLGVAEALIDRVLKAID